MSRIGAVCLLALSLFFGEASALFSATVQDDASVRQDWLSRQVDLECQGRPLSKVLAEVAGTFQAKIVYQENGEDLPVSCSYKMVTLEQIMERLFSRTNRAILVEDAPERRIIVQTFGAAEYSEVADNGIMSDDHLSITSDMTAEEVMKMQDQQLLAYRGDGENEHSAVPGLGVSRAVLAEMHDKQVKQYTATRNSPEDIVADMNVSFAQLSATHEEQLARYALEKRNLANVNP